jgi:hypothetical protein
MKALARREMILLSWTLGGVLSVPYIRYAWATNSVNTQLGNEPVSFLWEGSRDELNKLKRKFSIRGELRQQDVKNPLVYVLAGTLLLREFANIVHTILCQQHEGKHEGILIDARGEKIKILQDPKLFRGTVIIIGKDRTETKACNQLTDSSLLLKLLEEVLVTKK